MQLGPLNSDLWKDQPRTAVQPPEPWPDPLPSTAKPAGSAPLPEPHVETLEGNEATTLSPLEEEPATLEQQEANARKQLDEKLKELQALPTSDLQNMLKKKISALLRAHKTYSAHSEAERNSKLEASNWRKPQSIALPTTDERKEVRSALDLFQDQVLRTLECARELFKNSVLADCSFFERSLAAQELRETVKLLTQALPELAADDVFAAASHLSKSFSSLDANQPSLAPGDLLDPGQERTPEQIATFNQLADANFARAALISAALKLETDWLAAAPEIKRTREVTVPQPVRPSEEEVQRYLAQLEQFMVQRQIADRRLLALAARTANITRKLSEDFETTATLRQELLQLFAPEMPTPEALKTNARTWSIPSEVIVQLTVSLHLDAVAKELHKRYLDYTIKPQRYDSADEATVSSIEAQDMAGARKHMRVLAFAMGRLNEAQTTMEAAGSIPVPEIKLNGLIVSGAQTWGQCLTWRKQKHQEQFDADRKKLTKDTKIELLKESVDAASDEVSENTGHLQRHLSICLAVGYSNPCNELRALFNACSWMCKPHKPRFPVYPAAQ